MEEAWIDHLHHDQYHVIKTYLAGHGHPVKFSDGVGLEDGARGGDEGDGRALELERGDGECFGHGGREGVGYVASDSEGPNMSPGDMFSSD